MRIPRHVVAEIIVMSKGAVCRRDESRRRAENNLIEFRKLCNAFAYGDCVKYLLEHTDFVFDGDVTDCYQNTPKFWIEHFGYFKSLILTNCKRVEPFSNSPSIRHLRSLHIWYGYSDWPRSPSDELGEERVTQEQLTDFISKCTSLHSLRLRCCGNIKSLDFIKGSNVRNLSLFSCCNLTSFHGIHESKVNMIYVSNCQNLSVESSRDLRSVQSRPLLSYVADAYDNVDAHCNVHDHCNVDDSFCTRINLQLARRIALGFPLHLLRSAGQKQMMTTALIFDVY